MRLVRQPRDPWWAKCREWKARFPVLLKNTGTTRAGVSNYVLLEVLSEAMLASDILVPGSSGAASEVTMQAFRSPGDASVQYQAWARWDSACPPRSAAAWPAVIAPSASKETAACK